MKFKVTRGHDGKWYVFRRYKIKGGTDFRWVAETSPCDIREEAVDLLPKESSPINTIIMST